MEPILSSDKNKIWSTMSEAKKQEVLAQALEILQGVAKQQLNYIEQWKLTQDDKKESLHIYVFGTAEIFWNNVSLVKFLGQGEYANFAHYPARTCMETFLQFWYFSQQSDDQQNRVAIQELLRPIIRFFKREKSEGKSGEQYKSFYDLYKKEFGLPDNIEEAKDEEIRPFPRMKKICELFHANNSKQAEILFFLYQYLCESVHGKIFSNFLRQKAVKYEEYRRSIMIIYQFAKEILVLLDNSYLDSRFRSQVESAIKEADTFIANSVE